MARRFPRRVLVCALAFGLFAPFSLQVAPSEIAQARGLKGSVAAKGEASVSRRGGKLVLQLPLEARCPKKVDRDCLVVANLSGRSGAGIAASLGAVKRTLRGGRNWRVRLQLNRTARKALREARVKVLALVAVQTPDGQIVTRTAELTLRRSAEK